MATTNAALPAPPSHFIDDKAAMRAAMQAEAAAAASVSVNSPMAFAQAPPPPPSASGPPPAWGSYLYQNFLLPAFSPSEWIQQPTTPSGGPHPAGPAQHGNPPDYFVWAAQPPPPPPPPSSVEVKTEAATSASGAGHSAQQQAQAQQQRQQHQQQHQHHHQQQHPHPHGGAHPHHPAAGVAGGPSAFYPQPYYPAPSSISTSLLHASSSSSSISPVSVDLIDNQISLSGTPSPHSGHAAYFSTASPPVPSHASASTKTSGVKRRASSLESDSHDEHDIAEGVERDGMIWGMKVDDYRALSARERKRVRNRISARTFRAKRKEHLSSLETDLEAKDVQIKAARDEAARLRAEVAALKKRLSQYE